MKMVVLAAVLMTGACVSGPATRDLTPASNRRVPSGATIEPSGYATILAAAPPPYRNAPRPPERPEWSAEARIARRLERAAGRSTVPMNPDRATRSTALSLRDRLRVEARGNFVDVKIERDPEPRFAFYFRRDAVATLARFTNDPRFRARNGGIPKEELEPLYASWERRFRHHRLVQASDLNPIEGYAQMFMGVSEAEYEPIAVREGWKVPASIRLKFAPPLDAAQAVAPSVHPLVRVFARAERVVAYDFASYRNGLVVLRDGCFRIGDAPDAPLALFEREYMLGLDDEGFMEVRSVSDPDDRGRVGELFMAGGYVLPVEGEPGLAALRAQCGAGPIIVARKLKG